MLLGVITHLFSGKCKPVVSFREVVVAAANCHNREQKRGDIKIRNIDKKNITTEEELGSAQKFKVGLLTEQADRRLQTGLMCC